MQKIKLAVYFSFGIVVLGAAIFYANYDSWVTLPKLREPVRAIAKDPGSAQFKAERLTSNGWHCGEMNAKNDYGAYVGFKRFISNVKLGKIYYEESGLIGELNTEEILKTLDKQIEFLKRQNEIKAAGGKVVKYSDSERERMATREVFEDHWQEICQPPNN